MDPWSPLQPSAYWKSVQYSFGKSPLEIVEVLPICILLHWSFVFCILFCGSALQALNCVIICREPNLIFCGTPCYVQYEGYCIYFIILI